MPVELFSPITMLAMLESDGQSWVDGKRGEIDSATIESLRDLNRHWFQQDFGMRETVAALWLVNQRLTTIGIGPAWRSGPIHADLDAAMPPPAREGGLQRLGSQRKKALMRRWIDLDWLRNVLGSGHAHGHRAWQHAFSGNALFAHTAWERINKVQSTGGGKFGATGAYTVVSLLKVPTLHRLALTGLVDKNSARRRATAQRRVKEDVGPRLELLLQRGTTPAKRYNRALTEPQVAYRTVISEAIELGQGRPGEAATIFSWMTGQTITPQSIHAMRVKIADQCGLTRMYWGRKRAPAVQT